MENAVSDILKAIEYQYLNIENMKVAMYEDLDTVVMNLSIVTNDKYGDDEILSTIYQIL